MSTRPVTPDPCQRDFPRSILRALCPADFHDPHNRPRVPLCSGHITLRPDPSQPPKVGNHPPPRIHIRGDLCLRRQPVAPDPRASTLLGRPDVYRWRCRRDVEYYGGFHRSEDHETAIGESDADDGVDFAKDHGYCGHFVEES